MRRNTAKHDPDESLLALPTKQWFKGNNTIKTIFFKS